jgi:hypothetical protein
MFNHDIFNMFGTTLEIFGTTNGNQWQCRLSSKAETLVAGFCGALDSLCLGAATSKTSMLRFATLPTVGRLQVDSKSRKKVNTVSHFFLICSLVFLFRLLDLWWFMILIYLFGFSECPSAAKVLVSTNLTSARSQIHPYAAQLGVPIWPERIVPKVLRSAGPWCHVLRNSTKENEKSVHLNSDHL